MRLNSTITKAILAFGIIFTASASHAQDENPENAKTYYKKPYTKPVISLPEGWKLMPTGPKVDTVPNTMSPTISAEAKMAMFQTMMMLTPWSLRDMITMLVAKKKVAEGIYVSMR